MNLYKKFVSYNSCPFIMYIIKNSQRISQISINCQYNLIVTYFVHLHQNVYSANNLSLRFQVNEYSKDYACLLWHLIRIRRSFTYEPARWTRESWTTLTYKVSIERDTDTGIATWIGWARITICRKEKENWSISEFHCTKGMT